MTLQWPSFKIDLESFNQFLRNSISNADGIVADDDKFIIVESAPFSQADINSINSYYNSLTEDGEQQKIDDRLNGSITLTNYTNNTDAKNHGLSIGSIYQTNGIIKIVY